MGADQLESLLVAVAFVVMVGLYGVAVSWLWPRDPQLSVFIAVVSLPMLAAMFGGVVRIILWAVPGGADLLLPS